MKRPAKPGGAAQGAAGARWVGDGHDSGVGDTGRSAGHAGKSKAKGKSAHNAVPTAGRTPGRNADRPPGRSVDRPNAPTSREAGQGTATAAATGWTAAVLSPATASTAGSLGRNHPIDPIRGLSDSLAQVARPGAQQPAPQPAPMLASTGDSVWARSQGGDPALHRAALEAAAHTLGLNLPAQVFDQLQAYQALLLRWNKVYNLSAIRDADRMRVQHLVDCLAVLPALQRVLDGAVAAGGLPAAGAEPAETAQQGASLAEHAGQPAPLLPQPRHPQPQVPSVPAPAHHLPQPARLKRLLDVGSGGGLPGVVLAIARPDWAVDCVDTVGKKATFIRQVAAELGLPNLCGLHSRVEALAPPAAPATHTAAGMAGRVGTGAGSAPPLTSATPSASVAGYDLITSRAFASLSDFTRLTTHLLRPGGVWAAMKGRVPDDEITGLPAAVSVFHVEHLTVPTLDAERCLVWMRPATGG